MEGMERLEAEVLEMNNCNVSAIFEYLKTRKDLSNKFCNQEKTIKAMYKYICDKARSLSQDNVAMVNDRVVYIWAITYFTKSNEELGIKKEEVKLPPSPSKVIEKIENKKQGTEDNSNQISIFKEVEK